MCNCSADRQPRISMAEVVERCAALRPSVAPHRKVSREPVFEAPGGRGPGPRHEHP